MAKVFNATARGSGTSTALRSCASAHTAWFGEWKFEVFGDQRQGVGVTEWNNDLNASIGNICNFDFSHQGVVQEYFKSRSLVGERDSGRLIDPHDGEELINIGDSWNGGKMKVNVARWVSTNALVKGTCVEELNGGRTLEDHDVSGDVRHRTRRSLQDRQQS